MEFRLHFMKKVIIHYGEHTYSGLLHMTFEDAIRSGADNIALWTNRTTDQVLQDMIDRPYKYRIQFDGFIEKVS